MEQTANVRLAGRSRWEHIRDGKVIDIREVENLVVDAGLADAAGLLNGQVTDFFEHVAIGTGTTAATATDTQLQNECTQSGGQRGTATTSQQTTDTTDDTAQWIFTFNFTSGASYGVTESGVFNSNTAGNMLCRQTFSAINVSSGDSLQVTWKVDMDTQ